MATKTDFKKSPTILYFFFDHHYVSHKRIPLHICLRPFETILLTDFFINRIIAIDIVTSRYRCKVIDKTSLLFRTTESVIRPVSLKLYWKRRPSQISVSFC